MSEQTKVYQRNDVCVIENLCGLIHAADGEFEPYLFLLTEGERSYGSEAWGIKYGPRRVDLFGNRLDCLLAVETPDGHFEFDRLDYHEDRNGLPVIDVMKHLREKRGLRCKAISGDEARAKKGWFWKSWRDYIDTHTLLLSENGFFSSYYFDWDGWVNTGFNIHLAKEVLIVTQDDARFEIREIELSWAERHYAAEAAFRDKVRAALAAPHEITSAELHAIMKTHMLEKDWLRVNMYPWEEPEIMETAETSPEKQGG